MARRSNPASSHTPDPVGEWREPVPHLREPRFSQSLERGLAILECFTPERPVRGIADLADELGMSRSTTHRYVLTLTTLGYLVQGARRKYRLGLRVTELGMAALGGMSLREHARPYLEELSVRTPYTIALGILDGPQVVYLERLTSARRGAHPTDLDPQEDSQVPAHCSAIGKLLLAHLPASAQRELLGEMKLQRRGPNTITGTGALRKELARILERGLAVSDQELAPQLYEIAVPVRSQSRETVAALGMAAHSSIISLEALVEHLAPHLISTADRISARLGYRRDDERRGGSAPAAQ
jgi:IclR family transcriptional regulator, pca regulon regulatory protein